MKIEEYLQELDELISVAPEVIDIKILRRSVWDTGMEKIAMYRYKLTMSDASVLELTERLVEMNKTIAITKYRHHWQNEKTHILKRWDNAPHHRDIETFPHHLHEGAEDHVISHGEIYGLDVLNRVISFIAEKC